MIRHRTSRSLLIAVVGLACAIPTAHASLAPPAPQPPAAPATPNQPAAKPNFVVFMVDDLDATVTPTWDVMTKTKKLIADRGLRFANALSPDPICCPARSSTLTGQFAHNTGVLTNAGPQGGAGTFVRNGGEERTFPLLMQRAGYRTMLAGKYLNGMDETPTRIPPGWTEWFGTPDFSFYFGYNFRLNENGTLRWYRTNATDYSTDVVARKTMDFIHRAEADDSRPFMAYVASTAPHIPLPPAPRHLNNPYRRAKLPRTPNVFERDLSDKSTWLRRFGHLHRSFQPLSELDYRTRLGSLLALDDLVAGTVKTLETHGELDNTHLVFVSDNGYNNGSHGLLWKQAPYEESLRVPLVIAGPEIRAGTESRMVALPDLAPTLLELAGIPAPSWTDGRSLVPLLHGEQPPSWRDAIPIQYVGVDAAKEFLPRLPDTSIYRLGVSLSGLDVPTWSGIRTSRYTYVEFDQSRESRPDEGLELYDLQRDPYQLNNLLGTPAGRAQYAPLAAELKAQMQSLGTCKGTAACSM